MRRVPIRQKLAAAMAVPLTALVIVVGLQVRETVGESDDVRDQAQLAQAALGPDGLIEALQNESSFAAAWIGGMESSTQLPVTDNAQARRATDRAIEEFREATEEGGDQLVELYQPAFEALEGLGAARATVDGYPGPRELTAGLETSSGVVVDYAAVTEAFFQANARIASAVDDSELRTGTELVNLAARQVDTTAALTRTASFSQLTDGGIHPQDELPELGIVLARFDAQLDAIDTTATGDYRAATEVLLDDPSLAEYRELLGRAQLEQQVDVGTLIGIHTGIGEEGGYRLYRQEVSSALAANADDLVAAADARTQRYLVLAVAVVLGALLATWLTARSITRPLQSLRAQATDVAERRLPNVLREVLHSPLGQDVTVPRPEPVEVNTRDEVRDVADALSTVQQAAVDLAVEQAVLRRNIADTFVNLGRRNQNLLGRQLDFITQLEHDERDPDALGSLFRLDHLATRMRRNAESLLVLAGVQPPRTFAAPVSVLDIVRSALGEVEGYERVSVRHVQPVTVAGAAASDLAHMLAELIENALVFSPPDRPVEVRGQAVPQGYVLSVHDAGPGMSAEDVHQANVRLAGAESFTVAPSKYLGHYVAGGLAARHGVTIRLDSPPGRGLTASVALPADILASAPGPPPALAGATR
jgi:signal transduction histidine kinase